MILYLNLVFFFFGEYVFFIFFMKVGGQLYLVLKFFCLKLLKKEIMYMFILNIFFYIKSLKKNYFKKIKLKFVDFLLFWFIFFEFQWSSFYDQVIGVVDFIFRVYSFICDFVFIFYVKVI